MFLVLSIVLALLCCVATWFAAYGLAQPHNHPSYSKSVGWLAGAAGFPFLAGAAWCAEQAAGEPYMIVMIILLFIGMFIASPTGEACGNKKRKHTYRITSL